MLNPQRHGRAVCGIGMAARGAIPSKNGPICFSAPSSELSRSLFLMPRTRASCSQTPASELDVGLSPGDRRPRVTLPVPGPEAPIGPRALHTPAMATPFSLERVDGRTQD